MTTNLETLASVRKTVTELCKTDASAFSADELVHALNQEVLRAEASGDTRAFSILRTVRRGVQTQLRQAGSNASSASHGLLVEMSDARLA
jgi:hypothetical protein